MYNKFVVFINRKFEPVIVLDNVLNHKEIKFPESFGEPSVRCGGGWWDIKSNVLELYEDSFDFGKYDLKTANSSSVTGLLNHV